jgi:transposase
MKFVSPLNEATRKALWAIVRSSAYQRGERAHAVLLSGKGYRLDQLASIFERDRDTVSAWITDWETHAFDGLDDAPRSGRPRKTTVKEDALICRTIEKHPQQSSTAQAVIKKKGITISYATICRRLSEAGYTFKRIVKRPAKRPDPKEYAAAKKRLRTLESQDKRGEIDLYFGDAAGFSLGSVQPYAWQHSQRSLWIDVHGNRKRLNVFGLFKKDNQFQCCVFEESLDDRCVIASIDNLIKNRDRLRPAVIVLDNSSLHHTDEMMEAQKRWKKKNVRIEYLPTYSPQLNRIEILWKRIKYQWLPLEAYYSFANLRRSLYAVLNAVGTKYRISFD